MQEQNYWNRTRGQGLSRRRLMRAGAAAGAGLTAAWLAACAGGKKEESQATKEEQGAQAIAAGGGAGGRTKELLPPGLEQAYPLIAKYHWSKLTQSQNKPKYGGRLKLQLQYDTPSWDPYDPAGGSTFNVPMTFVYNRLMTVDMSLDSAFAGKNNLFELVTEGDLAQSSEIPDKTTFVFKMRDNVKWHNLPPVNGRAFTAEDVVYTYRQYIETKSVGQSSILRDVDKIEAPDQSTVKITTRKPAAYLLNSLSAPLAFVIAREARERPEGLKPAPPIGTGPFIVKEHRFRNALKLDKNPSYFKTGKPYLDGIDLTFMPDPATAIAAFRTGQIHTIMLFGAGGFTTFEDLVKSEGWSREGGKIDAHVNQMNSGGNVQFGWRVDQAPYNDVRLRRALSMALDRDKMTKAVYGEGRYSLGFPTDWTHAPGKPWPQTKADFPEWFQYNPDKAKELLAQAGFQPGQLRPEIHISSTTGAATGPAADQAALVQELWKKIGVEAQLKVDDQVAFNSIWYGKKTEPGMVMAGAGTSSGVDLDDFTYRIMRTGEIANYWNISDPQLDALLDAQQAEFDREKRKEIARKIMDRDLDNVYRLWTVSNLFWEVKRPSVQNWVTHDVYMFANGWGSHVTETSWLDQ